MKPYQGEDTKLAEFYDSTTSGPLKTNSEFFGSPNILQTFLPKVHHLSSEFLYVYVWLPFHMQLRPILLVQLIIYNYSASYYCLKCSFTFL